MKTNKLLSFIILLVVCSSLFAQEQQPKTVKRIKISDFILGVAFAPSLKDFNGTLEDFKAVAPESNFLKKDFTGYSLPIGTLSAPGNTLFSGAIGILISDHKKTRYKINPLLRFGLTYFRSQNFIYLISGFEQDPFGNTNKYDYWMIYNSDQLRFDGSLIFRTNPQARISVFVGAGVATSFSFNAWTQISETIYYPGYPNGTINTTYEITKSKNIHGFSVAVPIGVDIRIFKNCHLIIEYKPSYNALVIPESRTIKSTSHQFLLGLKVAFK